jgi:opacity protein-like surface antigen
MKKMLLVFITLCALITPLAAQAEYYMSADGGANWISKRRVDFDVGYVYAGQVGYKLMCTGFRFEVETSYRKNDVYKFHLTQADATAIGLISTALAAKGSQHSRSALFHILYDIPCCEPSCLAPYIGAGVGYSRYKLSLKPLVLPPTHTFNTDAAKAAITANQSFHQKKKGFAWDILAGLCYQFNEYFDLDLHYHYLQNKRSCNHSFEAGLKFNF